MPFQIFSGVFATFAETGANFDMFRSARWREHAAKKIDKRKGLFWIGLMFEDITDDEYARFWAGLPAYVRLGYTVAGPASYRSGVARVRGR